MTHDRLLALAAVLSGAWLVGGCAADAVPSPTTAIAPAPASPGGLTGTSWRLVEVQSMDDAQGTSKVGERVYEIDFGADGRAALKLDCNRGGTSYTVVPASEPGAGSVTFGPAALTRAMCPPGSLDTKIARDLQYVRGYRVAGDTLSLSLMADGGIYVWKRVP